MTAAITAPKPAASTGAHVRAEVAPGTRVERAFLVTREAVDVQARTARLAFASETPYERFWGIEILDCTAGAVRMGRLQQGGPLLCDHDTCDVVGVVESVEIGADKVCRAVVRFGKSARADEVWQDVVDGIRRNVSVGYIIHKALLVESAGGVETYRVTDWEPFEVSLVSVPADASVGVGRSAQHTADTTAPAQQRGVCVTVSVEVEQDQGAQADGEDDAADPVTGMSTDADGAVEMAAACVTPPQHQAEKGHTVSATTQAEGAAVAVAERNHAAEITKIAAGIPGGAEMAMDAIQRGITVEAFQMEAIRKLSSKPVPTADVGLSAAETRRYSFMRAVNALANPQDAKAQREAAFERECSAAVEGKLGKQSRGLFVPFEVQKRDLTAGTNNAGGFTVATDLLAGSFIDLLRNAMVFQSLGTTYLTGLQGNIAIPKLSAAASAFWVAENAAPTESQQTLAQVTMSPKTVGAFTDISRRLMLQSSIDVEGMVQRDLAITLALAIEQAAISGTGASNQPTGLLTAITSGTVGGTNGLAPAWDPHIIGLETSVAVGNAAIGSLAYLTNAKVRGKLKRTQKFSGTNGDPVWERDGTMNGYKAAVTNAVPSNLTKGTSSGVCSAILFGNFADLVIGLWGTLDLMVDPYTGSTAGTVRVVALQDCDVGIRNTVSFDTMVDALTV